MKTEFMISVNDHGGPRTLRYAERDVSDFLENVITGNESHAQFAAKIFDYWCIDDEKFNGFLSAVKVMLGFLSQAGVDVYDQQCLQDFKTITGKVPLNSNMIERWAESYSQ